MRVFESGYHVENDEISDSDCMECKICWYLYDPAQGDEYWQIQPGTPFSALPDVWCCPECDNPKSGFVLLRQK
ncbi:rubredoxin [Parasalinivibrio latis]|uniref:rubredoxin n=1 Tax=Parasalinivibrio latis TaxID=2952610 RepID=UPI0030DE1F4E